MIRVNLYTVPRMRLSSPVTTLCFALAIETWKCGGSSVQLHDFLGVLTRNPSMQARERPRRIGNLCAQVQPLTGVSNGRIYSF